MGYAKHNFVTGGTIQAAPFNEMDDQIIANMGAIAANETAIAGKVAKPAGGNGTSGQVLQTNGDGTTSWVNQSGGGGGGGGGAEIDDTAGAGDTDKVWSADKVYSEFYEEKTDFNGIIATVEGENLLNATIIENKYASYTVKQLANLTGAKAVEFDVSRIVKFIYKFKNQNPDNMGLYFVDENGTALQTAYQALAVEQDITVPEGAAKCYATANFADQIFVYQIVGIKPKEVLRKHATYTSKTSGGVTYTWSQDHSQITVSGTRSGATFTTMYNNSSAMPDWLQAGKKYRFSIRSESGKIGLAYIPIIDGEEGSQITMYSERVVQISEAWTGISIRILTAAGSTVDETIDCPEIYTIPDDKSLRDEVNDLKAAANGSPTNPLAYIRRDAGFLSLFHTVGCIGDSLASGECAYKDGGTAHYIDLYPFSWGQCLARLTGNTYHNFSQGGLTTKSWLASSYATDCFDGNHNCDAYYIGLGQNDKNTGMTVGTAADINLSDYTQNADTYCGNMGKIIQKVQELQPKAPIFVFTDPNPPMGDQSYNDVIDDIVELFSNVWIIDLRAYAKDMFTNSASIIGSQYRSGHYSAMGYQEIAFVIATYTDWIVRNNLSAFSQVEFIGTNYAWTN